MATFSLSRRDAVRRIFVARMTSKADGYLRQVKINLPPSRGGSDERENRISSMESSDSASSTFVLQPPFRTRRDWMCIAALQARSTKKHGGRGTIRRKRKSCGVISIDELQDLKRPTKVAG